MVALAAQDLADPFQIEGDWLSVALPRPADECYDAFCDVERTPEWLNILRLAVVTERDTAGRPRNVAFLCRLHRATVGYTLTYRYRPDERRVSWSTPRRSSLRVRGFAQFQELAPYSCLMTYCLDLALGQGMPHFEDASFDAHATSATLHDFRDFVLRAVP